MNSTSHIRQGFTSGHRGNVQLDAIEWEALPSLASLISQRGLPVGTRQQAALEAQRAAAADFNTAWTNTLPACLDNLPPAPPAREAIRGLITREVNEPEVFRHFFG